MAAGEHIHDWEYSEPIKYTTRHPYEEHYRVIKFCKRCLIMEELVLREKDV